MGRVGVHGGIGLLLVVELVVSAVLGPPLGRLAFLFLGLGVANLVIAVLDWRRGRRR